MIAQRRPLRIGTEPIIAPKPVVPQAPIVFREIITSPPLTASGGSGQVGTTVNSQKPNAIFRIGPIPQEPKPVFIGLVGNQVGTTSQQNPDNPAPTPPVGTFPPQKGVKVSSPAVAPTTQSMKMNLGLVAAVIIIVWFFLGYSFRGVL